jgi:heme A synthase
MEPTRKTMTLTRFASYAWGVAALNVFVILWGALVSSTGSGAGCGDHWPLCQGKVVPLDPSIATVIELTHRLTSGLALLAVIGLVAWAFGAFPAQHRVRHGALASLFFIIVEALLGAALVLFRWVALDTSLARVILQPIHLVNTLFLLAALTLTAWWASGGEAVQWRGQGWRPVWFGTGALGVLLVGASGAVISLGDLLAGSLGERYNALVEWLVGLRLWHPAIAVGAGMYLLWLALYAARATPNESARRFARLTGGLVVTQWLAGFLNVFLRAPVWMQLMHLFLADSVWIALVLWAASALARVKTEPVNEAAQTTPRTLRV